MRARQSIERIEELFLELLALLEELYVVHQQNVDLSVLVLEVGDGRAPVLKRVDVFVQKCFGRQVADGKRGVAAANLVADGLHQVRLAESRAAVDEKRVEADFARMFGDPFCGSIGVTVGRPFNKLVERIFLVQRHCRDERTDGARGRRGTGDCVARGGRQDNGRPGICVALEFQPERAVAAREVETGLQPVGILVLEEVGGKIIDRQNLEHAVGGADRVDHREIACRLALLVIRAQRGKEDRLCAIPQFLHCQIDCFVAHICLQFWCHEKYIINLRNEPTTRNQLMFSTYLHKLLITFSDVLF